MLVELSFFDFEGNWLNDEIIEITLLPDETNNKQKISKLLKEKIKFYEGIDESYILARKLDEKIQNKTYTKPYIISL